MASLANLASMASAAKFVMVPCTVTNGCAAASTRVSAGEGVTAPSSCPTAGAPCHRPQHGSGGFQVTGSRRSTRSKSLQSLNFWGTGGSRFFELIVIL